MINQFSGAVEIIDRPSVVFPDHGYELRFSASSKFWIRVELHDQELDDFLFGLTEIIRDHVVPPEGNDDTRT